MTIFNGDNSFTSAVITVTATSHNAFQCCRGSESNVWLHCQTGAALLCHHIPLKPKQQHRAADTQSTLCGVQLGHYALQPALEHPAEPFTSQPTSPPFTDLLLHAIPLHCLRRTRKASQGPNKSCLVQQSLLRSELELTCVSKLALDNCWSVLLTQTDGACATAPLCPLIFCLH